MPTNEDDVSIADLVRECLAEVKRQRGETVADGGRVTVPLMLRDGETLSQLRARTQTLDAYEQFEAGRAAWRKERDAELQAVIDGTGTPDYAAALVKREEAWQRRGERQAQAWQQRPAATSDASATRLQPNASLADAEAAREAAWQKRGEMQANAWKRGA